MRLGRKASVKPADLPSWVGGAGRLVRGCANAVFQQACIACLQLGLGAGSRPALALPYRDAQQALGSWLYTPASTGSPTTLCSWRTGGWWSCCAGATFTRTWWGARRSTSQQVCLQCLLAQCLTRTWWGARLSASQQGVPAVPACPMPASPMPASMLVQLISDAMALLARGVGGWCGRPKACRQLRHASCGGAPLGGQPTRLMLLARSATGAVSLLLRFKLMCQPCVPLCCRRGDARAEPSVAAHAQPAGP